MSWTPSSTPARANCQSENLFCAGTYQRILQSVAKPVLEKAVVKLERVVSKISRRDSGHDKVRIETKGGEAFEFDDIVLTAPLGWLKKNLAAFEQALPPRMEKAIGALGYGCLEKVAAVP